MEHDDVSLRRSFQSARIYLRSPSVWVPSGVALLLIVGLIFGWITLPGIGALLVRTKDKVIEELHFLLPALVALIILRHEFRLKREQHEKEIELSRQQHEREMELNTRKFDYEQTTREEHRNLIHQETQILAGVSNQLSKSIIAQLKEDTSWASEALERARLGPYSKTLFGERVGHFLDEKRFIAERFMPELLQRCRYLINSNKSVCLLIDSGTTLLGFFRMFGKAAAEYREKNEDWITKIEIYTNNLPGIEALMDSGRTNPGNRYSPLAIKCELLPGEPLPVYSAVIGAKAIQALKQVRMERNRDTTDTTVFIGLTTGNWVRLRRSNPMCPVPLARGEGHLQFKQALIECSDEVYVVAPLGKVFVDVSLVEINEALGFSRQTSDADKRPYEEVNITDEKARVVKLVSSQREDYRALFILSQKVKTLLAYREDATTDYSGPSHLLPIFKLLPPNWTMELQAEFPHTYTSASEFRHKYFNVPEVPPTNRPVNL